jgi:hypothetical protein
MRCYMCGEGPKLACSEAHYPSRWRDRRMPRPSIRAKLLLSLDPTSTKRAGQRVLRPPRARLPRGPARSFFSDSPFRVAGECRVPTSPSCWPSTTTHLSCPRQRCHRLHSHRWQSLLPLRRAPSTSSRFSLRARGRRVGRLACTSRLPSGLTDAFLLPPARRRHLHRKALILSLRRCRLWPTSRPSSRRVPPRGLGRRHPSLRRA